jgi:hypothetical protein
METQITTITITITHHTLSHMDKPWEQVGTRTVMFYLFSFFLFFAFT